MTFDADDKIIVGRVLDVDDLISFHRESVAEFEAMFHAAVDGDVAVCEELASAPDKPVTHHSRRSWFATLSNPKARETTNFSIGIRHTDAHSNVCINPR